MSKHPWHWSIVFFLGLVATSVAQTPDLGAQQAQLNLIKQFANDMCASVPLDSSTQRTKLSANGQAKVSGLAKKLVDLGASASFERDATDTSGVLQSDLAGALKDTNNCKLKVIELIAPKILQDSSSGSGNHPATTAPQPAGLKIPFAPTVSLGMAKDGIPSALSVQPNWQLASDPGATQLILNAPAQFGGISGNATFHVDNGRLTVARLIFATETGSLDWVSRFDFSKNTEQPFGVSEQTYIQQCQQFKDRILSQALVLYNAPVGGQVPFSNDLTNAVIASASATGTLDVAAASEIGWDANFEKNAGYSAFRIHFSETRKSYTDHRSSGDRIFNGKWCSATLLAVSAL